MRTIGQGLAVVVLPMAIAAFCIRYLDSQRPLTAPTALPAISINHPHYGEILASQIADQITKQVVQFHADHGQFPACSDFWTDLNCKPICNPITGSSEVAPIRLDMDATKIGWVLDQNTGAVYPGGVFGSTTRP